MAGKKEINLLISAKDTASKTISALNRRFGALSKAVAGVGAAIASYLSVRSITGFFRSAVAEAADLEAQLSRVGAVTRAVPEDMAKLKAAAEEMGASTKFTATQAAEGMEALGRAGLGVADTLEAIPSVLALAAGQNLELGQSASIVASAVNGMRMSFTEAGRVADVLALAASSADTNVEGLSTALSYAAPNAVAARVEIEELSAYIGTLASAGYDGSRAGTALSRMMAEFVNPASNMRRALAEAGITTDDFTEAMEQLEAKGDAALPVIVSLGQRAGPALRTLLGQGIGGVKELTASLQNANGAAGQAAATMADNLRGAITSLNSAWSALKITLVDPLLEPITEQVRILTDRIRALATGGSLDRLKDALGATFQRGVDAVTEFVASLGTVDQAIDRLTNGISSTLEWFSRLANAGKFVANVLTAAFKGVDAGVSAVAAGITTMITGIAFGIDKVIQALNFLGLASDGTALKSAALVQTLHEITLELGKRTVQSAKDAGNAVLRAGENLLAMGDSAEQSRPKIEQLADSVDGVAEATADAENGIFRSVEAFEAWAAAADETAAAQDNAKASTDRTVESLASLREKVTEAADELNRLVEAGASVEKVSEASYRLEAAHEALATATRAAREEQRQMGEQSEESRELLASLGEEVDDLEEDFEDLEDTTAATNAALASIGQASADAASNMDELQQRVRDAEDRLKLLISTGAGMDRITEASRDLELAQRDVREALAATASTAGETERGFDAITEAIKGIKTSGDALARMTAWRDLRDASAEVARAFRDGRISAEEYQAAVQLLNERYRELRTGTNALTGDNKALAESFYQVGDAAEDAGKKVRAAREGYGLADPSSVSDLDQLREMLTTARETTRNVQGFGQRDIAHKYQRAIEDRIAELEAQNEEAKRETELIRASNRERETARAPRFTDAAMAGGGSHATYEYHFHIDGALNNEDSLRSLARQLRPILEDINRRRG